MTIARQKENPVAYIAIRTTLREEKRTRTQPPFTLPGGKTINTLGEIERTLLTRIIEAPDMALETDDLILPRWADLPYYRAKERLYTALSNIGAKLKYADCGNIVKITPGRTKGIYKYFTDETEENCYRQREEENKRKQKDISQKEKPEEIAPEPTEPDTLSIKRKNAILEQTQASVAKTVLSFIANNRLDQLEQNAKNLINSCSPQRRSTDDVLDHVTPSAFVLLSVIETYKRMQSKDRSDFTKIEHDIARLLQEIKRKKGDTGVKNIIPNLQRHFRLN